jgi:hypothetical protein
LDCRFSTISLLQPALASLKIFLSPWTPDFSLADVAQLALNQGKHLFRRILLATGGILGVQSVPMNLCKAEIVISNAP